MTCITLNCKKVRRTFLQLNVLAQFLLMGLGLFPVVSTANVGIPVVSVGWPFLLVNLIFVVAIEVLLLRYLVSDLKLPSVIKEVSLANIITTILGYPLVAILLAMSAIFGMNIGWILPYPNLQAQTLYLSFSVALTLVPCYFLSVWVEGWLLKKRLSPGLTWKKLAIVHLGSYAFLMIQIYTHFPVNLLTYGSSTMEFFYKVVMTLVMSFVGSR